MPNSDGFLSWMNSLCPRAFRLRRHCAGKFLDIQGSSNRDFFQKGAQPTSQRLMLLFPQLNPFKTMISFSIFFCVEVDKNGECTIPSIFDYLMAEKWGALDSVYLLFFDHGWKMGRTTKSSFVSLSYCHAAVRSF